MKLMIDDDIVMCQSDKQKKKETIEKKINARMDAAGRKKEALYAESQTERRYRRICAITHSMLGD